MVDGNAKVDLWPDMTELGPGERFATGFLHADGRTAEVFSSQVPQTVARHFQWMREAGIDGAFVQRFAEGLRDAVVLEERTRVLAHCREGARRHGRAYAVMYDLTGVRAGGVAEVAEDWLALQRQLMPEMDPAYLKHRGRPLVAVWGVGFGDGRAYSLAECRALVEALHAAGCSVMLGVPDGWRTLDRDAASDATLHEVLAGVEVVSPWTIGRYGTPAGAQSHGEKVLEPDVAWCRARGVDYLPVVYPGFSWANMYGGPSDQVPRLRGEFLWSQMAAVKKAGARALFVAMFDEVDEGTAVFKCTNEPPVGGQSRFVTYEGLASDFYLWLCGMGGRLMRGEVGAEFPRR